MKYLVFVVVLIAVAAALPVEVAEVVEDEEGQQYYLVPVSRQKR